MQLKNEELSLSPSDLTGYLACRHLTTLDLRVARRLLTKPSPSKQAELVFRKGREHEAAYLERLKAEGKSVREISLEHGFATNSATSRTMAACRSRGSSWRGRPVGPGT